NLYNEDKKATIITQLIDQNNKTVITKETTLIIKTGKNTIKQEQISFSKPELSLPSPLPG
ncbi:unnamed protein product, partial [marine sediment metagenome]